MKVKKIHIIVVFSGLALILAALFLFNKSLPVSDTGIPGVMQKEFSAEEAIEQKTGLVEYRMTQYADKRYLFRFFYNAKIWQLTKDTATFGEGVQLLFRENLLNTGTEQISVQPTIIFKIESLAEEATIEELTAKMLADIKQKWQATNITIEDYKIDDATIKIYAINEVDGERARIKFYILPNSALGVYYQIIAMAEEREFGLVLPLVQDVLVSFQFFSDKEKFNKTAEIIPPEIKDRYDRFATHT